MRSFRTSTLASPVAGLLLSLVCTGAAAHPMAAQRGTLNVVDDGAYLVVSIPVSAFAGVDDDQDGRLSTEEFHRHQHAIAAAVIERVVLSDAGGACALEGLLLSPAHAHDTSSAPSSQLVAMGRYALNNPEGEMTLSFNLFGAAPDEQALEFSARRSPSQQRVAVTLTPTKPTAALLPAADS
ncbi:MAG: hypothetical protein AAGA23_03255 [Pseudomonadota bacterium]